MTGPAVQVLHLLLEGERVSPVRAVDDHRQRALLQEQRGDGGAQPARAAGHEHHLAGQAAPVEVVAVLREALDLVGIEEARRHVKVAGYSMLRAVVFDFDGVLVDSEPLHFRALRGCLLPEGIEIDESEYYATYVAYDDRTAIRLALERHGTPYDAGRVDRVAKLKSGLFDELLGGIPFFPGARELVRALAGDLPLAIASGALRSEIERILAAGGLRECFRAIVGAEDVRADEAGPDALRDGGRDARPRVARPAPRGLRGLRGHDGRHRLGARGGAEGDRGDEHLPGREARPRRTAWPRGSPRSRARDLDALFA